MERKKEYEQQKELYGAYGQFTDYNLVVAHPVGTPVDPRRINDWLYEFQEKHPDLPHIVFHGVRHSSTSYKSKLSNGDIKSVQAHTGHQTTSVLMDRYAHEIPEYSKDLSEKFSQDFYNTAPQSADTNGSNILNELVLKLVKDNPELLTTLLQQGISHQSDD